MTGAEAVPGDRVRSAWSGRTGTVTRVGMGGPSHSVRVIDVRWDDTGEVAVNRAAGQFDIVASR